MVLVILRERQKEERDAIDRGYTDRFRPSPHGLISVLTASISQSTFFFLKTRTRRVVYCIQRGEGSCKSHHKTGPLYNIVALIGYQPFLYNLPCLIYTAARLGGSGSLFTIPLLPKGHRITDSCDKLLLFLPVSDYVGVVAGLCPTSLLPPSVAASASWWCSPTG